MGGIGTFEVERLTKDVSMTSLVKSRIPSLEFLLPMVNKGDLIREGKQVGYARKSVSALVVRSWTLSLIPIPITVIDVHHSRQVLRTSLCPV